MWDGTSPGEEELSHSCGDLFLSLDSGLGLASLDEADEMGYSCSRSEAVLCTGSVSTGQGPLPSRASRDDDGVPEEALSMRPSAAVTAVHPIIDIIYVL